MHKGDSQTNVLKTLTNRPWYILGGGAIGSLWACYLRMAGLPVVLITRQHPIQQLKLRQNTSGASSSVIDSTFDVESISPQLMAEKPKQIDKLIVCTKAPDTLAAVQAIENALAPNAHILLLQNGMGSQQSVVKALDENIAIYAGVVTHGAWKPDQCEVVHAGVGKITIGAMNLPANKKLPDLMGLLEGVALNLNPSEDIEIDLLKKWVINCAINPLTAVYRCKNGELNSNPEYRKACSEVCDEIQQVITAKGIANEIGDIEAIAREVIAQTAENISSMHQDILKGNPTEIDFINGYLVQEAQKLGIDTPINKSLVQKIKAL